MPELPRTMPMPARDDGDGPVYRGDTGWWEPPAPEPDHD